MDIVERLRFWGTYGVSKKDLVKYSNEAADEIEQLREALQQITELSPFKSNTGNASMLYENLYSHQRRYITQMLVKMTALAHEALKEPE